MAITCGLILASCFIANREVIDPDSFRNWGGVEIPPTALEIKNSVREFGPFKSDGVRTVEFECDSVSLQKWMKSVELSGKREWKSGPAYLPFMPGELPDSVVVEDTQIKEHVHYLVIEKAVSRLVVFLADHEHGKLYYYAHW